MAEKILELVNISKSYGEDIILDDLNLYMNENKFLTLLGPSGCGKTTTLRILGGFESPDQVQVLFRGKDIIKLPPNERPLNTVFQKYALFTHMNIAENIAFGLKIKKKSNAYIQDKIKWEFYSSSNQIHSSRVLLQFVLLVCLGPDEVHQSQQEGWAKTPSSD